jgi:hypothetical protein
MMKKLLLVSGVLALTLAPLAPAQSITDLTGGLSSFTKDAIGSLPFAASAGMDWSNAYIGQLIDTDFPFLHLGVGGTVGLTTIPGKTINPLLVATGNPEIDILPLPFAVANVRVGGLLLPFDVGLKIGFLPESLGNAVSGYAFRYQNIGADIRLNLIKSDVIMPDISVGAGVNMLNIGVDKLIDAPAQTYTDLTYNLNIGAPKITLDMQSLDLEVKGQISKTILWILTPYVGATVMMGSASAKSGLGASGVNTDAPGGDLTYWSKYGIDVNTDGFVTKNETATFGVKIFGGASLNVLILKIDAQGMYNVTDGAVGASLGARLQI